ncbi:TPA: phage antirepressor KilAC domain-containing protein [Clostridioides difficile]|uniref:Phage antirepressor KilAC domain-containing protein n=1 Tax=Clostridioides difficile TaxID=1496 RepID=A0A9P3YSA3_CLODI|nr:phage antirepressor KilAC domain-containing protein [Clostridioides difficile]EKS6815464.1 phage antirepressor KilAC domain-containing protein [Clostridioides difficile]MBH7395262.1 phage antirepressor KilAC domain-containing protein [Clostridioides difficile]MBY1663081.1 phage antirepressor KilAC domain-containing protein [Clostridioides difficile]MCE4854265.1 phage antirepressor KilAC domain-containing protein [Clostridioides difficile]MCI4694092.1 phage antirepressor KilAC domain-contain
MNDLTIIKQNNQFLVESREVAELIEKKHDNLLRDIRGYKKILEDSSNLRSQDFFIESTYINTQNKIQPCYLLTKKGCDMVANKMTGEKGIIFTAIYVTKFEEMERELKEQQPKLPTTYKEALQQLLIEVEEKEQLQLENQEKDKVIQLQQPKVLFADSVASSDNSILVGELAKLLRQNGIDTGQNRLFDWLRNNGYLIKRKGEDYNTPTQKSVDLGVIETKEGTRVHPDGHTSITKTPKITGKGQIYFINKFKKNNQISMLG